MISNIKHQAASQTSRLQMQPSMSLTDLSNLFYSWHQPTTHQERGTDLFGICLHGLSLS